MEIISTYATLQTAVASYLARDDMTQFVPTFIQLAEEKLYRSLNLRNEETALSVSISGGSAAVPTDFKALKYAYFDATPANILSWVPIEEIYRDYPDRSSTCTPAIISREAATFIFGPASIDGTLKGVYWAKQDPMRTTDPSWYVTNAPDVMLYASLLEATPFIQDDPRIPVWKDFLTDALTTLANSEDNAAVSMGNLAVRTS